MTIRMPVLALLLIFAQLLSSAADRTFKLDIPEGDNPSDYCITLANSGPETAMLISFKLNGRGFYSSVEELLEAIKCIEPEYPGEPDYRKAWRFTRDYSYNCWPSAPLTGQIWQHRPALFLNSLGFGYCDDTACIDCLLWRRLGYQARVWGLSGHVVPEILVDGRWEMYDASFGVYYYGKDGRIAGVKELEDHPEFIRKPLRPINPLTSLGYQQFVADRYSSKDDNKLFEDSWLADGNPGDEAERPLVFEIPQQAKLVLPLPPAAALKVSDKKEPPKLYADAALELPAGWSGTVDIALVIHAIGGKPPDTVMITGSTFKLGTQELQKFIDCRADGNGVFFSFIPGVIYMNAM